MLDFIINVIFYTLAIYGLTEILKNIYYIITYTNLKSDGIHVIITVKNQENKIEVFLRTILFRMIYGKEDLINQIIIADLGSTDDTVKIIEKIGKDCDYIKPIKWKDCKEIIDNISQK